MEFRHATIERADGSRSERDLVWHPGRRGDPRARCGRAAAVRPPVARRRPTARCSRSRRARSTSTTGVVEDPDLAARRELEEETGYRAASWHKLAEFWTAPGFASELMHLYLADGLTAADADRLGPDEDEHLELERLTMDEALAKVDDGTIADAKSIVGLLWLDRMDRERRQPAT